MRAAYLLFRLAIADLFHDRLVSICQIVMAAAVVAPLLLLFALKHGVATTLLGELRANPETLRIRPVGTYRLGEAFFKELAARPETAFVTPTTRAIVRRYLKNITVKYLESSDPTLLRALGTALSISHEEMARIEAGQVRPSTLVS